MTFAIQGFRPVKVSAHHTAEHTQLNIIGLDGVEKGFSIGGMRFRTSVEAVIAFFVARPEPPGTLLVHARKYYWSDSYDLEKNESMTGSGIVAVAPAPAASLSN